MATLSGNDTQTYLEHLEDEYQNLKNLVFQYDEAIAAIVEKGAQSYQLDTGQSMQRVTRFNIKELQETRDIAATRLGTLALRLRKTVGTKQIAPGW